MARVGYGDAVVRPQSLLRNRQRAFAQRLDLDVPALEPVEQRQVFEIDRDVRMVRPERFLIDRQGALIKRLRLAVAPLGFVEPRDPYAVAVPQTHETTPADPPDTGTERSSATWATLRGR